MTSEIYASIEGRRPVVVADVSKLSKIPLKLPFLLPDLKGNIAFTKDMLEEGNYLKYCTKFDNGVFLVPNSFTKKFFKVQKIQKIYSRDEQDVKNALDRIDHDFKKTLKEVIQTKKFKDGSFFLQHEALKRYDDNFYEVYWIERPSCCGFTCNPCLIFYFPSYSARALEKYL